MFPQSRDLFSFRLQREMAERGGDSQELPKPGKVQEVCQQWLVHEDGQFAYKLQNEEIDSHYKLNRFNRRTVREDIPVAKVVQKEEEKRRQEERLQELCAIKLQSEEDKKVAKRVMDEMQNEENIQRREREMDDQEIARAMQEREKLKMERYQKKKREKQLKKEREKLEKQLAQQSEAAGLTITNNQKVQENVEHLGDTDSRTAMADRNIRVTPSGKIEDDGDFSDFFVVPKDMTPEQERVLQEQQDEELARLLQEQEHKRNRAEVDRDKLRVIESHDARLAEIIQEQEMLKQRKTKLHRNKTSTGGRTGQRLQNGDISRPRSLIESPTRRLPQTDIHSSPAHENVQPSSPSSARSTSSWQHSRLHFQDELSTVDVPEVERWLSGTHLDREPRPASSYTSSTSRVHRHGLHERETSLQETNVKISSKSQTMDRDPHQQIVESPVANKESPMCNRESWTQNRITPVNSRLSQTINNNDISPPLSPPGSYHSDEDLPFRQTPDSSPERCVARNSQAFNIATAIDPTYKRRQHELESIDETETKLPVMVSRSLPAAEEETTLSGDEGFPENVTPSGPGFQPVQGQRRSTVDRCRKPKKLGPKRGNCKQQ